MDSEMLMDAATSGGISAVIALVATGAAAQIIPPESLQWALIAVGIASFLSGSFGWYYATQQ